MGKSSHCRVTFSDREAIARGPTRLSGFQPHHIVIERSEKLGSGEDRGICRLAISISRTVSSRMKRARSRSRVTVSAEGAKLFCAEDGRNLGCQFLSPLGAPHGKSSQRRRFRQPVDMRCLVGQNI